MPQTGEFVLEEGNRPLARVHQGCTSLPDYLRAGLPNRTVSPMRTRIEPACQRQSIETLSRSRRSSTGEARP
jgi:hypothetical protein